MNHSHEMNSEQVRNTFGNTHANNSAVLPSCTGDAGATFAATINALYKAKLCSQILGKNADN